MSEATANLCTTDAAEAMRVTIDEQAREIERLRLNIAEYNEHERCYQSEIAALTASAPNHSEQVRQMVPEGFRVMKPTSSIVRPGERWEIYAPCGSGGIVHEDDVTDWVVRKLLDAAATPSAGSQKEQE